MDEGEPRAAPRRIADVERTVNEILRREWHDLISSPDAVAYYSSIFDRTVDEGFYSDPNRVRGHGETPTWGPNEAYIRSHEKMWEPVDRYLESVHLKLESTFHELFFSSREYEDSETEHRRVFWGQLCDRDGRAVTAFMLTVPHSHECFRYSAAIQIALSGR